MGWFVRTKKLYLSGGLERQLERRNGNGSGASLPGAGAKKGRCSGPGVAGGRGGG